jgi:exodeoxyribonuclease V beta subunit
VTGGDPRSFDLAGALPAGWVLIEASAGTGKTYSLTAMVARYVAETGVRTDELLMVTFTRAAAAELREQTRVQIATALAALRRPADEVVADLSVPDWVRVVSDCATDERDRRR